MGLNPYRIGITLVCYFIYLDEVRTRMYPWAYDMETNLREQYTLLSADGIAFGVCLIMGVLITYMVTSMPTDITRMRMRRRMHRMYR